MRPRATSSRISVAGNFSRCANVLHFFRNHSLTGVVHLGHVALSTPLSDPSSVRIFNSSDKQLPSAGITQSQVLRDYLSLHEQAPLA